MSVIPNVTHMHYTAYADPVIRPASPASSVGTAYGPDQTAFSDLEEQIPQPSFEQKWEELIGLHHPRKEELVADRDPLLSIPGPNGQLIPIREKKLDPLEEKMLHDRVMASLQSAVSNIKEQFIYDQILERGSKAAIEELGESNDIDVLMRSMMGPSMNITAGKNNNGRRPVAGITINTSSMTNGPWNNFGQPSESERRAKLLFSPTNDVTLSGTTVGKRSRNGTSRNPPNA